MVPMSFISPMASPTPAPTPRTEPATPSSTASISTDLLTCLRLEPSARISPISRVRWATSIEKVLTIRKMPTRTAIPAKPSIAYFMHVQEARRLLRLASAVSCLGLELQCGALCAGPEDAALTCFLSSGVGHAVCRRSAPRPVYAPGVPSSSRWAVAVSK